MATGRGGLGDYPWNYAEFLENFIANFGYNPFVGTGIGPSEGDIPNVEQINPEDAWQNVDPSIKQFFVIFSKYVEGLDSDDMDRVARQEEANRWLDMYNKYKNDEISLEELKTFEPVELAGMPGWDDYFQGIVGEAGEGTEGEGDPSTISDEDAIANILSKVPDKLKGLITEDNIIEVLKTLGGIEEPMTAIKRGMIAGIEIEFPKDWEDWKVFGTIRIPGVPLPPGIVDVTLRDIVRTVSEIGGTVEDFIKDLEEDPEGTLKDLANKVIGKVEEVFGGDADDPGWGGSVGGFKDWVNGIFGQVLGGTIFGTIYDEVSGYFEGGGDAGTVPPIGGDEVPDEGKEPIPLQGDDIADFEPDFESDSDLEFGGFGDDDDDDDDDTAGGLDDIELGDAEEFDPDPVIPGGDDDDDDDDEIILGDAEDEDEQEIGGGSNGGAVGGGGVGGSPFEGMLKGLSYQPQPVPGIVPPPQIDYAADLDQLIARQLQQRGMFT